MYASRGNRLCEPAWELGLKSVAKYGKFIPNSEINCSRICAFLLMIREFYAFRLFWRFEAARGAASGLRELLKKLDQNFYFGFAAFA